MSWWTSVTATAATTTATALGADADSVSASGNSVAVTPREEKNDVDEKEHNPSVEIMIQQAVLASAGTPEETEEMQSKNVVANSNLDDDEKRPLRRTPSRGGGHVSFSANTAPTRLPTSDSDLDAEDEKRPTPPPSKMPPPPPRREVMWRNFRELVGSLVKKKWFNHLMVVLIISDAIILGALTFDGVDNNDKARNALENLDFAILCAFTVEVLCQLIYLGFLKMFQDGWLVFDACIVAFSWAFLESPLIIMRSLRILRLFTLVSRWESVKCLFEAAVSTLPKMTSIWVALWLIFNIFAVLFTTLYSDLYEEGFLADDYFGRLDRTLVTLFQIMTLDNWSEVAREVMVPKPWSFVGFFLFIMLTSFFVINLVVAVICESLIEMETRRKSAARRAALLQRQQQGTSTRHLQVSESMLSGGYDGEDASETHKLLHDLQLAVLELTQEVKQLKHQQQQQRKEKKKKSQSDN